MVLRSYGVDTDFRESFYRGISDYHGFFIFDPHEFLLLTAPRITTNYHHNVVLSFIEPWKILSNIQQK